MTDDRNDRAAVVAICTRNRGTLLRESLELLRSLTDGPVLVVDSSDEPFGNTLGPSVTYIHTSQRSLARQRNIAIAWAIESAFEVIHFLDDDTRPQPGYFESVAASLDTGVAGVGGTVINQERPAFVRAKRLFLLYGSEPGRVLRSGRATIGHYPGDGADAVEWLPGCCMSYRLDLVGPQRFDDRLEGYSWGEDLDFSFRLSRTQKLVIAPNAQVVHLVSPDNRVAARRLARDRTLILHRWVSERRRDGMSLAAFWWSVVGEVILRSLSAMRAPFRHGVDWSTAIGVMEGVLALARRSGRRA